MLIPEFSLKIPHKVPQEISQKIPTTRFLEVEVLVPLVEHVHPLGVIHPLPHQQLLSLQAPVNPVKHRPEDYQHAEQP